MTPCSHSGAPPPSPVPCIIPSNDGPTTTPEGASRLADALRDRYRIERELGAGGMATVYLAHDARHDRRVAIKVLKPELGALIGSQRFLSEIRTTANLQHPHILPLFDSGAADSLLYYVMPYIEGISLRDRLTRDRQLSVAEATRIASEIGAALDYAHRHGIIHRDIKPENILLNDGSALVADFGIALAADVAGTRMTETGMSLGTPQYMSPEQAMGERALDARTDVYSLGCVTYEMLAGEPPFSGPSAQAIVARVMTSEPSDLRSLRRTIPDHVADAVHIALEKVPADRFARAADFVGALAGSAPPARSRRAPSAVASQPSGVAWVRVAPYGLALMFLAAAAMGWLRPARPGPVSRHRVALWQTPLSSIQSPGVNSLAGQVAIAPDGASIVFADSVGEHRGLWLKHRSAADPVPLAGTEGGIAPFFSPNGAWIGYFTPDGTLKKVPVTGGGSITLVPSEVIGLNFAATWLDDGNIVFVDRAQRLVRIPGDGGAQVRLTLDSITGQVFVTSVTALPGSRGVLYTACRGNCVMGSYVSVLDIASGRSKELVADAAGAWYARTGHLLYADRTAVLFAAEFDLRRLELASGAMPVLDGVAPRRFAVSRSGTLVYWLYQRGGGADLVWVDRSGTAEPLDAPWRGEFEYPAVSPDGETVAVSLRERTTQLWIRRSDGTREQLTQQGVVNWRPSWSPDGRSIAFSSGTATDSGGDIVIKRMPIDGSAPPELLQRHTFRLWEAELSRDGRWLLTRSDESGVMAIRARRLDTDTMLRPILVGGLNLQPALSPDGRWLAHVSTIDGQPDIFVTPFPGGGPSRRVSRDGGGEPRWARNGRELFFKSNGTLMSVAVTSGATLALGTPRPLFSVAPYRGARNHPQYDVTPDGRRFLMIREPPVDPRGSTIYVENWFTELEAKLAARPASR